jgi:hypothetical protein
MMYINMWAVLVSAIAATAIGSLWYSPLAFGKSWMKMNGIDAEKCAGMKMKDMAWQYVGTFATALVTSFILSKLISWVCSGSVTSALKLAGMIWFAFIALGSIGMVMWEKKPWALYAINVGYSLVSIIVSTLIIISWK